LDSPENLLKAIELSDDISRLGEKLYVYAHLKSDEDTSNNPNRARMDRVSAAFAKISGVTAFFEPEILAGDEKMILDWVAKEPLKLYKRSMEELLRGKKHVLSAAEERLVGLYSDVLGGSDEIFSIMNNSDMEFDKITDEKGNKVQLTHSNYYSFMINPDRKVRRRAFK
jgi:oligoendopeptidase F